MHKQPFTFGKYLLGIILISIIIGVTLSQKDVAETTSSGLMIFFSLYITLGFILWGYQTIKYGKLNRREEKIRVAELEKREKDAGLK